jgi:hypothetical protein
MFLSMQQQQAQQQAQQQQQQPYANANGLPPGSDLYGLSPQGLTPQQQQLLLMRPPY